MTSRRERWAAPGDVNAFFGWMLDNISGLLLAVRLLAIRFEFPTEFALRYMVPGTAFGGGHIGICAIFVSSLFKSACAAGSNWIRRLIPRAGLLGSLAAIGLVLPV